MRHLTIAIVAAASVSMFALTTAVAQQPSHQHDASKEPPAATAPQAPTGGMAPQMAQQMEMCRMMMGHGGMMGGSMGGDMMGPGMMRMPMMMGGGDPKEQAEMLAMRGEMMKAMGEIMMKYAQRAQSTK